MIIVGIDVSKNKLDVSILLSNGKETHKVFENNQNGFDKLISWMASLRIKQAHVCLESTGCYGEAIALVLHQQNHKVSIINPLRIKAYARSEGCRTKTDKVDSGVIARFCKALCPPAWNPPSLSEQKLKDLYRCRQNLLEDKNRVSNRLEKFRQDQASIKIWQDLLASIESHLEKIEVHLKELLLRDKTLNKQVELLKTIPGISDKTAIAILAELPNIESFNTAKEVAAFAGLNPYVRQSGSSVKGKGRLSKVGNAQLRKALYMPAIVAKKHNPLLVEFSKRLAKKGKPAMVIIAAGMRKLLHIIFGVLKSGRPFTYVRNDLDG